MLSFILFLILVQGKDRCSNFNRLILYRKNMGHRKLENGRDIFLIQITFLVLERNEPQILKWYSIQKVVCVSQTYETCFLLIVVSHEATSVHCIRKLTFFSPLYRIDFHNVLLSVCHETLILVCSSRI